MGMVILPVLAAMLVGAVYVATTRPCVTRFHKHRHWRWSGRHAP